MDLQHNICFRCGRPKATDQDFDYFEIHELENSEHLCWLEHNPYSCLDDSEVIERLLEENSKLKHALKIMTDSSWDGSVGADHFARELVAKCLGTEIPKIP